MTLSRKALSVQFIKLDATQRNFKLMPLEKYTETNAGPVAHSILFQSHVQFSFTHAPSSPFTASNAINVCARPSP